MQKVDFKIMEQKEFLERFVFTDLENLNAGFKENSNYYFSETDFGKLLERIEYYGIGIYSIEVWLKGVSYDVLNHEKFKKKATNPDWYKKAFSTFTHRQEGLLYSATYKVSNKLLARYSEKHQD